MRRDLFDSLGHIDVKSWFFSKDALTFVQSPSCQCLEFFKGVDNERVLLTGLGCHIKEFLEKQKIVYQLPFLKKMSETKYSE
jgi:hypothetical protein